MVYVTRCVASIRGSDYFSHLGQLGVMHYHTFFATLIRWPDGIVLGNLIASAIWATPALIHLHLKLNRQHKEHMKALGDTNENSPND